MEALGGVGNRREVQFVLVTVLAAGGLSGCVGQPTLDSICDDLPPLVDCRYQDDAGSHRDASNECESPSPEIELGTTTGMLAPVDDPADFYAFDVPAWVYPDPPPQYELTLRALGVEETLQDVDSAKFTLAVHKNTCDVIIVTGELNPDGSIYLTFGAEYAGIHVIEVSAVWGLPGPLMTQMCHESCGETVHRNLGYSLDAERTDT